MAVMSSTRTSGTDPPFWHISSRKTMPARMDTLSRDGRCRVLSGSALAARDGSAHGHTSCQSRLYREYRFGLGGKFSPGQGNPEHTRLAVQQRYCMSNLVKFCVSLW